MKDFRDKVVYITGGSQGIGLAAAKQFASRGAHVIVFARRQDVLEQGLKEIGAARISDAQRFSCMPLDVADHEAVKAVMFRAVTDFGVPDVLFNCAGYARPNYFEQVSYAQFDDIMHVDLYGAWNTISALAPVMRERGGYIVNTASVLGLLGVFGYADYCAAKFGIVGLSEVLRGELKWHNITVSVLCPTDTETPGFIEENKKKPPETWAISGAAKIMRPEDVAKALLRGMRRKEFIILADFNSKLTWWMKRFLPGVVDMVMDADIRKVQKKQAV